MTQIPGWDFVQVEEEAFDSHPGFAVKITNHYRANKDASGVDDKYSARVFNGEDLIGATGEYETAHSALMAAAIIAGRPVHNEAPETYYLLRKRD